MVFVFGVYLVWSGLVLGVSCLYSLKCTVHAFSWDCAVSPRGDVLKEVLSANKAFGMI